MTKRQSYGVALTLLLILLLAGALRVYDLGGESLWLDETFSVRIAHLSVGDILTVDRKEYIDLNPPLYFLLLHGWVGLAGDSEAAVRAPSVAFGIAAVAVLFLVGVELRDIGLGLVAAFLSATSYFLIRYSQEARMYSLLVLLSATSFYFLIRMIRRGEAGKTAVGYAASTALLFYTHYHAVFLVLAQLCAVACFWRRLAAVRRQLLTALAVAALAFGPWLPILLGHIRIVARWNWWVPVPTIRSFKWLYSQWVTSSHDYTVGSITILPYGLTVLFGALILIGFFTWAKAPIPKTHTRRFRPIEGAPAEETVILLALWLFVPVLASFAFSQIGPSIFLPHYLIGVTPALYLLVARGVVALNRNWLAVGLCLVILALYMPGLQNYYRLPQKEQWNEVGQLVEREGRPGDMVLLAQGFTITPFIHYYSGPLDRFAINDHDDPVEASKRIEGALIGHRRIWLVVAYAPQKTAIKILHELLPQGAIVRHRFVKIDVLLYEIPPHLSKQVGRIKPLLLVTNHLS